MVKTENSEYIHSTCKQALYLWIGLSLSLALFFVNSQMFFINANPLPTSKLEWIFTVMGVLTFLLGHFFFKNYMSLRKGKVIKMPMRDRKQAILIAFVMQFILFETLGLYGVLLSVLRQNTMKAIPFVVCAYIGFFLAFPKKEKISPYFV